MKKKSKLLLPLLIILSVVCAGADEIAFFPSTVTVAGQRPAMVVRSRIKLYRKSSGLVMGGDVTIYTGETWRYAKDGKNIIIELINAEMFCMTIGSGERLPLTRRATVGFIHVEVNAEREEGVLLDAVRHTVEGFGKELDRKYASMAGMSNGPPAHVDAPVQKSGASRVTR